MTDLEIMRAKVESYRVSGFDSSLTDMQMLIGATALYDAHTYLAKQYPECMDFRFDEDANRRAVVILGLLESQLRSAIEFKMKDNDERRV